MNAAAIQSEARDLSEAVDETLAKAGAIVWLMAHQDTSEVVNDDAVKWAGMAAQEFIDEAIAAVQAHYEKTAAKVAA